MNCTGPVAKTGTLFGVVRNEKFQTLWPLPGGVGNYLFALEWIVGQVAGVERTESVVDQMVAHYSLASRKAAVSYLRVAHTLGLIEIVGSSVYLTPVGKAYIASPCPKLVEESLVSRVSGCADITAELALRPRRLGPLAELMRERGHRWSTNSQVRYRLRWLEEVGVVGRRGTSRPEYHMVD
ncbi:hypothetical protein WDY80_23870 (plasmid) [Gordonia hongkongensis]|uniref:hypothetical protein n=1 Tax=Gordonia hongkongensis TaxID=1701090 RepID=UPI0030D37E38